MTTHSGRRLAGRLVYDLDESETTNSLDAPSGGVDYILPFGLVAAIVPRSGEKGDAVKATVEGQVTTRMPASLLQLHRHVELILDPGAASKLRARER